MLDVYTLKSCDTCRKALKWLDANNMPASNNDIRTDGIPPQVIAAAIDSLGWEKVLNRRSTTWRNLADDQKHEMDAAKAVALIIEHPTLMKRPLFVIGDNFVAGFDQTAQSRLVELTS